jgi:aminodeoxyfutalosine deaminase
VSTCLRARWVLPIDRAPIEGGWVEVVGGRIVGVGRGRPPAVAEDLGDVAILPGLVNAHTHLELSWMAGRIAPAEAMSSWIRMVLDVRRSGAPGGARAERRAAAEAAASVRATGTVLVGDVSNTLMTPDLVRDAGLGGVVFHEVLGFRPSDPAAIVRDAWDRVRVVEARLGSGATSDTAGNWRPPISCSVVAHAPYSVSPALFEAVARARGRAPLTVHLGESPEEIEFLRTGRGPMRDLLETLGAWTDDWEPPGFDPVEYLAAVGYLRRGVLVVHGVYLPDSGLERLREAGAVLVTCPRSNVWVGAGPPRLSRFYASGVPVAIGTDSLASVPSLNLFDELAEMRRLAPEVAASSLIESATRIGARALGFGGEFGTIRAGKRAAFTSVDIPPGVADVEEYLVGGVPASTVRPVTL